MNEIGPFVAALARRIATFPVEAVRLAKESVNNAEKPLSEALPDEAFLFQRRCAPKAPNATCGVFWRWAGRRVKAS